MIQGSYTLTASEALDAIASGGCRRSIWSNPAWRGSRQRMARSRRGRFWIGTRPWRRRRNVTASARRAWRRAVAWRSGRAEGHHRHRRYAHAARDSDLCWPPDGHGRPHRRALREAGAVIMGKTVTTELAFVHANETRNPHNPTTARGIIQRVGRGGGRASCPSGDWHADQRVRDPARIVLRRLRVQTHARRDFAQGCCKPRSRSIRSAALAARCRCCTF